MSRYHAEIRLDILEYEAIDDREAEKKLNNYIDKLVCVVNKEIGWDNADYTVRQVAQ